MEVLFIDYGNSFTCNSVRELPEDLVMLSPLALKCSLQKPPGVLQWSPAASDKFKEISQDGAAEFSVRKIIPGETAVVQLTLDSKDISEQLKPETVSGYISYFESIDNFWIQKSGLSDEIEALAISMIEAANWAVRESVKVGDLVAALSEDDECWYRAKVKSITENKYDVFFFDYGNSATVQEVRELTDDVRNEPRYAIQCKLDVLPGYKWPDDINKNLQILNNEGK